MLANKIQNFAQRTDFKHAKDAKYGKCDFTMNLTGRSKRSTFYTIVGNFVRLEFHRQLEEEKINFLPFFFLILLVGS